MGSIYRSQRALVSLPAASFSAALVDIREILVVPIDGCSRVSGGGRRETETAAW